MPRELPEHVTQDQTELFAFLADPATHGLDRPVKRIDTHGAALFLAGADVYKVKRAVRYPFMDYSSLEKRRAACEAEIAINTPFAPQLYLAAIPITRSAHGLQLGGTSGTSESDEIIDWAVHMRRFDESQTLDRLAGTDALPARLAAMLAPVILAAHQAAPARSGAGGAARLIRCSHENKAGLEEFPDLFAPEQVARRFGNIIRRIEAVSPLLDRRAREGFVRRCHGDMHLRNIVMIEHRPVLFDAIEFSDEIATSDILYDLAFLLMDLWERGLHALANELFCRYLWHGDGDNLNALAAMPLMLSLRAAIRAKVSAAALSSLGADQRPAMQGAARRYFDHARQFLAAPEPQLIAIGGLSGTGKSRLAAALAPHIGPAPGALVLRSDIERKLQAAAPETEALDSSYYTSLRTEQVYQALRDKGRAALAGGWPVIVDGMHARAGERNQLAAIARELKLPFHGLWLQTALDERRARVNARSGDASDADARIAAEQEDYQIGAMDWHRIDAGGSVADTCHAAVQAIGASG